MGEKKSFRGSLKILVAKNGILKPECTTDGSLYAGLGI